MFHLLISRFRINLLTMKLYSLILGIFFIQLCYLQLNLSAEMQITGISHTANILKQNADIKDSKHGIKMGVVMDDCDDAKTDLDLDWDGSPLNYTCYSKNDYFKPDLKIKTVAECDYVRPDYLPQHFCVKDRIEYNHSLPTYGDHRPLWPVFGEYLFVPPQRWLHSIEHGAIVMLYHPCAHPLLVSRLRKVVTNCIRKHVITRDSTRLTADRPLALIAWGCRMVMNTVDIPQVISFIQKYALHGPEGKYPKEGQYEINLLKKASIPFGSDIEDSVLCPFSYQN